MCVCRSIFMTEPISTGPATMLKRLHWLGLWHLRAAVFATASHIIIPEVEHCLAEMLHDVAAIEIDIFDQRFAIWAVEDDVLALAGWSTTLDDDADRVRRSHWRVGHVWRNEERVAFSNEVVDDVISFADPHLDVAFQLVKILLRVDEVEIVARVRADDHHHEEIAPIVQIAIAHRRLEQLAIVFDPLPQVDRRQDRRLSGVAVRSRRARCWW